MQTKRQDNETEGRILLFQADGFIGLTATSPLEFKKNGEGQFVTFKSIYGELINDKQARAIHKDYPNVKIDYFAHNNTKQPRVIFSAGDLLQYGIDQYQLTGNGTEILNINVKRIIKNDNLKAFKIMLQMFSSEKLKSIKILCSFPIEGEGRIVNKRLSIQEYAIYVNATKIIEYINQIFKSEEKFFPLSQFPDQAQLDYSTIKNHDRLEIIILKKNIKNIGYKSRPPIEWKYCPLIFKKSNKYLIASKNSKGDPITKAFTKTFTNDYFRMQAKVKIKNNNQLIIVLHPDSLWEYSTYQCQKIENGIEVLTFNIKSILQEDDLESFKRMEEMFSLYQTMNHRFNAIEKLKSTKIICSFNMKGKPITLNLSILEYAIYTNATQILGYLKEKYPLFEVANKKYDTFFPSKTAAFVLLCTSKSIDQIQLIDGLSVIPTWNTKTFGCNLFLMADTGFNKEKQSDRYNIYIYKHTGPTGSNFYLYKYDGDIHYLKDQKQPHGDLQFPQDAQFISTPNNLIKYNNEEIIKTVLDCITRNEGEGHIKSITDCYLIETAIELEDKDIIKFLLTKNSYNINYSKFTPERAQRVLKTLTDFFKDCNKHSIILNDDLLSKRKREVDLFLKLHLKNKASNISLKSLFEFYVTLGEYWYEKSRKADTSVEVPADKIWLTLEQAEFTFNEMNATGLKEINLMDVCNIGTIKSLLYRDAAANGGVEIDAIIIKQEKNIDVEKEIIKIQLNAHLLALSLSPNDQGLRAVTGKYATDYYQLNYKLAHPDIKIKNPTAEEIEENLLKYQCEYLQEFLNHISKNFESDNPPSIEHFLKQHSFYCDKLFDVTDNVYKRTLQHWMVILNQLDYFYHILPSEKYLSDKEGFTPIGLLVFKCGFTAAIELLKKKILPISQNDLLIHNNGNNLLHLTDHDGNSILHLACKINEKDEGKRIDGETILFLLQLFEKNNFNINCTNKFGMTPFDVLMQSISITLAFDTISIPLVTNLVTTFLNQDACLIKIKPTNFMLYLNLFDNFISANQFDLVKKLINIEWPLKLADQSLAYLLSQNECDLFLNILQIYHQIDTKHILPFTLSDQDIEILLTSAKSTHQQGAFACIIYNFEYSLSLMNLEEANQKLISFYYSLDSEELKNDFINALIHPGHKQTLMRDIHGNDNDDTIMFDFDVGNNILDDNPFENDFMNSYWNLRFFDQQPSSPSSEEKSQGQNVPENKGFGWKK